MTVNFTGEWRDSERLAAQEAINAASIRLAELTGLAPDEAFGRLFGDITLEALPVVAGDYYGYVSKLEPLNVQIEIGHIDPLLVLHELGHVITLTIPTEISPAELLSRTVIRTASGRPVTGMGRSGYSRHMGYRATKYTGYHSINYPAHQHPYNVDDGNTATEDWCDMWLSWVTGNIADNEAGQALRNWIETYLVERLRGG